VAGLLGVVLAGLWMYTDHAFSYRNENLLLFNPLALSLVVLAPAQLTGARWAQRPARWLGVLLAALAGLALAIHVVPGFNQVNGELIGLVLPVNWAFWQVGRRLHG